MIGFFRRYIMSHSLRDINDKNLCVEKHQHSCHSYAVPERQPLTHDHSSRIKSTTEIKKLFKINRNQFKTITGSLKWYYSNYQIARKQLTANKKLQFIKPVEGNGFLEQSDKLMMCGKVCIMISYMPKQSARRFFYELNERVLNPAFKISYFDL